VTRKLFLILLALVLALSVGLVACAGGEQEEEEEEEEEGPGLMIYQLEPVEVGIDYLETLTSAVIPIGAVSSELKETDEIYSISSKTYYLECCKNSASIWYADDSKLYTENYVLDGLPSAGDARAIAEEYLDALIEEGVIPEGVEFEFFDIGETQTVTFDRDTNETETVTNHLDVLYSFGELDSFGESGEIPVEGPGAKIRVSIGNDEDVIGLHYVWREIKEEPLGLYPAISEDDAIEIFKERLEREPEEFEVTLVYFAESEYEKQDFLQPYYKFDGTITIEDQEIELMTQLIPATTFSPIVTIESPLSYEEFLEGEPIDFLASVSGGEEPYQYVWESDIDGVIGTQASFSSDLSVAARDQEILPHAITLEVTDKNGNQDTALVSVTITPTQSTAVFATGSAPEGTQSLSTNSPNDDDNDKEVGVEWCNQGKLTECAMDAKRFRGQLLGDGWVEIFSWGDELAWEEDFKYQSAPGGGTDFQYIDAVDFAYFAGHGNPEGIGFMSEHDWQQFWFEDARWGGTMQGAPPYTEEGDLEWIVLDACNTLQESYNGKSVFSRWDQAFDGLHYVLGWHSHEYESRNRGKYFAQNMRAGRTIRQSWIRATDATDYFWHRAAYLRCASGEANTYYDHLPGHGYVSPDPYFWNQLVYMRWRT
jgi:hypothetical protein